MTRGLEEAIEEFTQKRIFPGEDLAPSVSVLPISNSDNVHVVGYTIHEGGYALRLDGEDVLILENQLESFLFAHPSLLDFEFVAYNGISMESQEHFALYLERARESREGGDKNSTKKHTFLSSDALPSPTDAISPQWNQLWQYVQNSGSRKIIVENSSSVSGDCTYKLSSPSNSLCSPILRIPACDLISVLEHHPFLSTMEFEYRSCWARERFEQALSPIRDQFSKEHYPHEVADRFVRKYHSSLPLIAQRIAAIWRAIDENIRIEQGKQL